MKINILGTVPVPVGHRVTVRWFRKTSKGLFGGKNEEQHQTQPLIEDLTTGIVHAFDWHYDFIELVKDEEGQYSDLYPSKWSDTLGEGVVEERAITGTVKACRIITQLSSGGGNGNIMSYTDLTLEPDSGYRQ